MPGSIQSLVQARIDRLAPADRQVLQAASVLGQRFGRGARQGEDFLFAHALIRDAVYDSLLGGRRRELHRRAALWLEGDSVLHAEHLDRAEDLTAPQAYLRAAGQQAGEHRYERALALVERGLTLVAEARDLFELTCLKGEVLHDLGRMSEAQAAFNAALGAAAGERERCRA